MPPRAAEDTNAKRAAVLAAVPVTPAMGRYLRPGDFIVACDGGLRNAAVLGVEPDLLIADFDSLPEADCPPGLPLERLPTVKDDTDTHHAARWLLARGFTDVTFLGALGGARLEHTLANLATGLFLAQNGVNVRLAGEHSELCYLLPGVPLALVKEDFRFFSLFPLQGTLTGVDIEHAKYPLHDATLTADFPLGVSNEFAAGTAILRCRTGCGLVVRTR